MGGVPRQGSQHGEDPALELLREVAALAPPQLVPAHDLQPVLAHPAGVDSIPTSGNQEDHVSMGWHAARKAGEVLDNVATVLAVEVLCAAQGIDLRSPVAGPGPAVAAVHAAVRDVVEPMDVDREVTGQIDAVRALLPALVDTAEQVTGPLR